MEIDSSTSFSCLFQRGKKPRSYVKTEQTRSPRLWEPFLLGLLVAYTEVFIVYSQDITKKVERYDCPNSDENGIAAGLPNERMPFSNFKPSDEESDEELEDEELAAGCCCCWL